MRFTPRSLMTLLLVLVLALAACQPATPVATVTPRPTDPAPEPTTVALSDQVTEEPTVELLEAPTEIATTEETEVAPAEAEATEAASAVETAVAEIPTELTEESAISPLGAEETREAQTETAEEAAATETVVPVEEATEEVPTQEATEDATLIAEITPEATAEATQENRTIADIAAQDGQFTILLSAVEAAGLSSVLAGSEPITVFAPTDEAFEALLETLDVTAEELLAREDLAEILMYHLIGAEIPADTLQTLLSRQADDTLSLETMLEGASIDITAAEEDSRLTINGAATVVLADVRATNGVIHVIDQVLLPPSEE